VLIRRAFWCSLFQRTWSLPKYSILKTRTLAEALGGAAECSYEQEAAVVEGMSMRTRRWNERMNEGWRSGLATNAFGEQSNKRVALLPSPFSAQHTQQGCGASHQPSNRKDRI
jgi:hypothetical protein